LALPVIRPVVPFLLFLWFGVTLRAADQPAAPPPPPFPHESLNVANGCLVESIYFYDQFRECFGGDAWVRVLQWGAKEADEVVAGHAVAVFLRQGRLWAWDVNYGFLPLEVPPAQREDVARISPLVLAKYPRITARYPLYRFDFPQQPDSDPPAPRLLDDNSAVRDASVVAAKLARHRPVNLVQFSYREHGETKQSAAAVFMFHGRYCVYTAEQGTVPFHAVGSVRNLHLIQEALRRIHPGAVVLKSPGGE
jgi:hypothetical protein